MWDRGPWIGPTPSLSLTAVEQVGAVRPAAAPSASRPIGRAGSGSSLAAQLRLFPYADVMTEPARPHRPVHRADLVDLAGAASHSEPFARSELAAATAEALITQGRTSTESAPFLDLADRIGLDTLAELWRDEQPSSLAGALWTLYVLRRWCQSNGDEVTRLWRAGRGYAPADEVVAGVSDDADPAAVSALADSVLTGAYLGDFAVALERAAAFFRVVAAGRRESAADGPAGDRERDLAARNTDAAAGLAVAAARWRQSPL
jgi:hypothetical protein